MGRARTFARKDSVVSKIVEIVIAPAPLADANAQRSCF